MYGRVGQRVNFGVGEQEVKITPYNSFTNLHNVKSTAISDRTTVLHKFTSQFDSLHVIQIPVK
jgi:hypothetical protein